ncbi:MAG: glycoside hydrolase family 30 beta sandwich domain-containing protein [Planctomycetota bacterium]
MRYQAVTAFKRPDRKVAVVVMNRGGEAIPFTLRTRHGTTATAAPAHSIMTLVY